MPRHRPIPPIPSTPSGSNPAKTFAGSDSKPAKTFPGSEPPARFAAAPLSGRHSREARARPDGPAHLAGPDRRVRVRAQLRVGQTVPAHDRAARAAVGVFESDPGQRGPGGFLPRGADPRRDDRPVETPVGVPPDALVLAARLRRSRVGSAARDVSRPARARVPRSGRGAGGRTPRQSQVGRPPRVLL